MKKIRFCSMFSGIEKFEHGFKQVLQIECANKINILIKLIV